MVDKVWNGWRWEWRDDEVPASMPRHDPTYCDGEMIYRETGNGDQPICRRGK